LVFCRMWSSFYFATVIFFFLVCSSALILTLHLRHRVPWLPS
jgi:hypothetical protein